MPSGSVLPKDWARRRLAVLERDEYLCQIDGPRCEQRASEVDHIVPRARGGSHDEGNLRSVCKQCHKERRRKEVPSVPWHPDHLL